MASKFKMVDFPSSLGHRSKRLFCASGHSRCTTEVSYMSVKQAAGASSFKIWAFTAKLQQLPVSWRIIDATDTPIDENTQIAQLYIVNAFRRYSGNVKLIRLIP
ncbi:hypothetical protein F2P79_025397 [Pimephales promelas]|nr:hypothetical protein F2P79_025397 [Pimephales promelas]